MTWEWITITSSDAPSVNSNTVSSTIPPYYIIGTTDNFQVLPYGNEKCFCPALNQYFEIARFAENRPFKECELFLVSLFDHQTTRAPGAISYLTGSFSDIRRALNTVVVGGDLQRSALRALVCARYTAPDLTEGTT